MSSIFDPLGFLSPIVLTAKILLQDIWRSGVGWDDTLPSNLLSIWESWSDELSHLHRLSIPRCYRLKDKPLKYDVHVFSGASTVGFGACVYIRAHYADRVYQLNLLLAKSRVAPLRQLSIPRLELQGAVMAVRLTNTVLTELNLDRSTVTYWCDSKTVLQWIASTSCKYHAFVAHRVTEILEHSAALQWRHIAGTINPADDCSRGNSREFEI